MKSTVEASQNSSSARVGKVIPVDSVEVDPVPEEQDEDWAVHVGIEPMLMSGKKAVPCRPSDAEPYKVEEEDPYHDDDVNDESAPTATPAADAVRLAADAARLWEDGSTAVPSTAEVSLSRWSEHGPEHALDPDCKAAPVPGLCMLNLENGITRFLHEADDDEQEM